MDKQTLVRTVVMILTWVNMYLATKGISPIPIDEQEISLIIMISSSLWVWWKNNNITPEAVQAHKQMKQMKLNKKTANRTGGTTQVEITETKENFEGTL